MSDINSQKSDSIGSHKSLIALKCKACISIASTTLNIGMRQIGNMVMEVC